MQETPDFVAWSPWQHMICRTKGGSLRYRIWTLVHGSINSIGSWEECGWLKEWVGSSVDRKCFKRGKINWTKTVHAHTHTRTHTHTHTHTGTGTQSHTLHSYSVYELSLNAYCLPFCTWLIHNSCMFCVCQSFNKEATYLHYSVTVAVAS